MCEHENRIQAIADKLSAGVDDFTAVLVVVIRRDGTSAYAVEAPDPMRMMGAMEYVRQDFATRDWTAEVESGTD